MKFFVRATSIFATFTVVVSAVAVAQANSQLTSTYGSFGDGVCLSETVGGKEAYRFHLPHARPTPQQRSTNEHLEC